MTNPKKFYLIDDDPLSISVMEAILTRAGHKVWHSNDGEGALAEIAAIEPDCVLTDLMMPGIDGYLVCRRLREVRGNDDMKIVIVSTKGYEYDMRLARKAGADGYVIKPIIATAFLDQIMRIIDGTIAVDYWGVRGTLPVSGAHTLKYGGATSCVSLTFPDDRIFVFDAGSGIHALGAELAAAGKRLRGKIFISHPHWDHINAFPFFAPLFITGNEFEVLGPAENAESSIKDLIAAQMTPPFFPITMQEFSATVTFRDLWEENLDIEGIGLRTMLLSHPGYCLGYRVTLDGRSICYVTDNELFPPSHALHDPAYRRKLIDFVAGADLLITDTTYTDEAYQKKIGWGHSAVGPVVEIAHEAGVRELNLFHHDPDENDEAIDRKLDLATAGLADLGSSVIVTAPASGSRRIL